MKYIVKFSKKDRMAYISHLDLQRLLTRGLRMAGVRLAYSNGFNPHPRLSIAVPLSLGFSSNDEYLEMETELPIDEQGVMATLNARFPEGLKVLSIQKKGAEWQKTLAFHVRTLSYELIAPNFEELEERLSAYLARKEILIRHYSKKKDRETLRDIRGQILSFRVLRAFNNQIMLTCTLSAGSSGTLNPIVLLRSFYEYAGQSLSEEHVSVLRTKTGFDSF
jgi:radical SAM-linked protein